MTIQELREARNKAWQGAKAFVESKRDKDGLLSKEDAEAYRSRKSRITVLRLSVWSRWRRWKTSLTSPSARLS